jgi:MSHA biogenesis protein MshI
LRDTFGRWFSPRAGSTPPREWVGTHADGAAVWLAHVRRTPTHRARLLAQGRVEAPSRAAAAAQWRAGHRCAAAALNALLAPADYQFLQLDAPPVPRAEWTAATRWKLKDHVDIDPEQAQLDCIAVPADEGLSSARMFAVVAAREAIRREMLEHHAARTPLRAIDVPEMALRNLLLLPDDGPARALMLLTRADCWIVLLWQGELAVTRRLDVGLARLEEADDEDRYALVERIALEFQRTADAFARQYAQADLRSLWLAAGRVTGELAQQLQAMLATPVRPFRLADLLDADAAPPEDTALHLAVGAALRAEA